jgi:hypothetical protein
MKYPCYCILGLKRVEVSLLPLQICLLIFFSKIFEDATIATIDAFKVSAFLRLFRIVILCSKFLLFLTLSPGAVRTIFAFENALKYKPTHQFKNKCRLFYCVILINLMGR